MNILKRNLSVITLGIIMVAIFLVISFLRMRQDNTIELVEITDPKEIERIDSITEGGVPQKVVEEEEDVVHDMLVINFTSTGFSPRESKGYLDQELMFVNTTGETIKIVQKIDKFEEFEEGLEIKSGESYKFVLDSPTLWTFMEENNVEYGQIFIQR